MVERLREELSMLLQLSHNFSGMNQEQNYLPTAEREGLSEVSATPWKGTVVQVKLKEEAKKAMLLAYGPCKFPPGQQDTEAVQGGCSGDPKSSQL